MPLTVNGERVEDVVIQREADSLRNRLQQMPPEEQEKRGLDPVGLEKYLWEWSKENVIERTLLRQEALRDPAPVPEQDIEKALEEIKRRHGGEGAFQQSEMDEQYWRAEVAARIRLDRLLGRITAKVAAPKNKEVADYYRRNKQEFRLPETIHAAHIVKHVGNGVEEGAARQAIEQVQTELNKGSSFEELADKYSDCPGNGGDLGAFPRGQMVAEFDEVVFSLGEGEVSNVFKTVFGFHIAKVYEHTPERQRTLAEVSDEIKKRLHADKQTRAIERFVDGLRAKADVAEAAGGAESEVAHG